VDSPVDPTAFAVLPGAVERVDDPYPWSPETGRVVGPLLGQDGVVGAGGRQQRGDQLLGAGVALVADLTAGPALERGPQVGQERPGPGGDLDRESAVAAGRVGRQGAPRIMPAPTVSLVASLTRTKLPVIRLRR